MGGDISLMRSNIYVVVSILIYAVLYLFTALVVIFCIFFSYLNQEKFIEACIRFWAKTGFFIMGIRLRIKGEEFIEKGENYLLLANHSSLFDILAIMAINPRVSWFGREYLLKIPVFGHLLRMINYIPMRTANVRNTKVMLKQLVEKSVGLTIAMFPEGTRTIDGKIQDFKRGFIHVLRAADVRVLPITLNGLYELKPKNRFFIKYGTKVEIIIHKPIDREELIVKSDKEIINVIKEVIESGYN